MLSTSWDFKHKISQNTNCLIKARLILADGSSHDLTGDDIMSGSPTFSHSTSSGGSFDIGAAVTGSFSCTLHNWSRKFDDFDFTGAKIIPSLGVELDDGQIEWLIKGTYFLEQPETYGTTIGISGLDSMCLLDEIMFSEVRTVFPTTAATLVRDLCTACGLVPLSLNFANNAYVFPVRPKDDMTCHDAISYIAQATGNYVRITNDNRLELGWYDLKAFESEDWLDGETFDDGNPYQSGDNADGGNFLDYNSGDNVEGGSFNADKIVSVIAFSTAAITCDDVIITGVKVTASDEVTKDSTTGEKGETVLNGVKGYVLEVESNPFIAYGQAARVAQNLYNQVGGMRFRPFDVSCLGDPSWEPGDPIIITDYNQRVYRSYITSNTYKLGSYQALACNAETPLRKASAAGSAITKALQAAREQIRAEKTAREAAIEQLNDDLASSSGMYTTSVKEGGATTWYVHDKQEKPDQKPGTFTQSQFVWKINAAGIGISIDGGKTYQYGLDKWGNAILDSIYAIGIDADHINTGSLRVQRGSKTIFCADVKAGQFWWDSTYSALTNTGELTVKKGNIGGFAISSSSITNEVITLTSRGMELKQTGTLVGYIGTNAVNNHPNLKGLDFNMEPGGAYMGWSYRKSSSQKNYEFKLCYAAKAFDNYSVADRLYLGCDLDVNNFRLRKAWIDPVTGGAAGGLNQEVRIPYVNGYVPGTNNLSMVTCIITFKNGFVTNIRFA